MQGMLATLGEEPVPIADPDNAHRSVVIFQARDGNHHFKLSRSLPRGVAGKFDGRVQYRNIGRRRGERAAGEAAGKGQSAG